MSNTVSLNANNLSSQSSQATATVTDNGNVVTPASLSWSSSDNSVATIDGQGVVHGVADPSGSGTKTATITATANVNGNFVEGTGIVKVVTTGDTVVVTVDFGPPTG